MRKFALDSNVMIYAEGSTDERRRDIAISFIAEVGFHRIVLPMQSTGETLRWLVRKGGLSKPDAAQRILQWMDRCIPAAVSVKAFHEALKLCAAHDFQIWDAVILATSAENGAEFLLSEDMQHGFRWAGVTIINPFILDDAQRKSLASETTLH